MKKHYLFTIVILLLNLIKIVAQKTECDCTIKPYKPDSCFYICSKQLLSKSTKIELNLILGLSDSLSERIVLINQTASIKNYSDYLNALSSSEFQELNQALKKLNQNQLNYFNLPQKDRLEMATDIKILMEEREKEKGHG